MSKIKEIEKQIKLEASHPPSNNASSFKTGKGEYSEGDIFLGIPNPVIRNIAKNNKDISYEDISYFIKSPIHEHRLFAVICLVAKYKKDKEKVYKLYLSKIKYVNNWDIVDLSTPHIIGQYILENKEERSKIEHMCESKNMWFRRISVLATFPQIKKKDFDMALRIIKRLLSDKEDLIHKACGWALREIYKKDSLVLEKFLKENYDSIPRTTLRYAIEHMEETKRKKYLLNNF